MHRFLDLDGDISMENNVKFGLGKLWRWKYWIIIACIASGVISIFFSQQMTDEFKSTAAFVPPSMTSLSTMVFGNGIAYKGFYTADEEDIDRTVAYMESPQVMDSLDKRFNLYEHYGINRTSKEAARKFEAAFKGNMKVSFTSNSVVAIECWDPDPQFAKDFADAALELASDFFENVSQRQIGLQATIDQLHEVDAERKLINDSLSALRVKYNIYHIDDAGPAVSEILAQKMRTEPMFNMNYDNAKSMELYVYSLELRYQDLRREQMARELNLKQYPSLLWVTEYPSVSGYKDRPKRSILVILAVMATFVFSSFLALALDRSKPTQTPSATV
jgi:capsule polysaccharide export protein KpsE/RkpR